MSAGHGGHPRSEKNPPRISVAASAGQWKTRKYAVLVGLTNEAVEEPAYVPRVPGYFRQTLLCGIQLLQHDHGHEDIVLLKTKYRRWIVHQNIRIENEQMLAG